MIGWIYDNQLKINVCKDKIIFLYVPLKRIESDICDIKMNEKLTLM